MFNSKVVQVAYFVHPQAPANSSEIHLVSSLYLVISALMFEHKEETSYANTNKLIPILAEGTMKINHNSQFKSFKRMIYYPKQNQSNIL